MIRIKYKIAIQYAAYHLNLPFEAVAHSLEELLAMNLITYQELNLITERIRSCTI